MSTYQVLAIRATISTLINVISVNVDLKKVMVDSVGRDNVKSLIIRVAQQNLCLFVTFFAIK